MRRKKGMRLAIMALSLYALYLLNVEIQSFLGKKAIQETGLQSIPFSEALKNMKSLKKPVLVELSAVWCPTCRKLDKKVFQDPDVQSLVRDKFIFSRLEYEEKEAKRFRKTYGVNGFPVLMVFKENRAKPTKIPLTFSADEFRKILMQTL